MANVNKVVLIGRLTRDPEIKDLQSGSTVCQFSLAVNGRKKDRDGQYVDDPCFLDCEAWNGQSNKLADNIDKYCKKGSQVYVEGSLKLDQWEDKDGGKRQKLKVVVRECQFLDAKKDDRDDRGRDDDRGRRRQEPEPRGRRQETRRNDEWEQGGEYQ